MEEKTNMYYKRNFREEMDKKKLLKWKKKKKAKQILIKLME